MTTPRSILIVRLSAAGDIVHTLPLVERLRSGIPGVRIGWVVEDRFAALVDAARAADQTFIVPRRAWKDWSLFKKCGALKKLVSDIRAAQYDAALDVQGLTKSALIPFLARIPKRIGFRGGDGRQGREFSPWLNTELATSEHPHVAERNADLALALGCAQTPLTFPSIKTDLETISAFLAAQKLERGRFIIINPGAGWAAKRWAPEHFHSLAQRLSDKHRIVVTWGGAAERTMAETIAADLPNATLAPDTDLSELWALLAQARLVIGCDTGPLHMAAAACVPTVALFGPTDAARNKPYGAPCEVVQSTCPQFPACWKKRFRATCTCMHNISVDMVSEACSRLLV